VTSAAPIVRTSRSGRGETSRKVAVKVLDRLKVALVPAVNPGSDMMTSTSITRGRAMLSAICLAGLLALGYLPAEANPREAPQAVTASAPSPPPVSEGCEVEERVGSCALEEVSAVESATGVREVVAVYRVLGGDAPARVERRYRASYLTSGEVAHMSFLRAHPNASCRWQTVTRGACPAHPATVNVPEPGARASRHERPRTRFRARHGRRAM
jgi:hypothetical protein